MQYTALLFALLVWTSAQASNKTGSYISQDDSYEMTYDELAQELAMKKREALPTQSTSLLGWGKSSWAIGYAFSSMQYQFPVATKVIGQNGLDFRLNQSISNSPWTLEGSLKKFGSMSSGNRSAESEVIGAMAKIQHSLPDQMSYTLGVGGSFNWIHLREAAKRRESLDLALRASAGLQGPITNRFTWGLEMNALSPVSGKILKGGLETSLLISSSM